MLDEKFIKKAILIQIKNKMIVAISDCCDAPLSVKEFTNKTCKVCGIKLSDDKIYFYSDDKYEEKLKRLSN